MPRLAAFLLLLGCYRAHSPIPEDAAPSPHDAGVDAFDARLPPRDAGFDAHDAALPDVTLAWDAGDAGEPPPPCRLDGGRDIGRLAIEAQWSRPTADVVMTPLVVPIDGRPQILVNLGAIWKIDPITGDASDFDRERRLDPARLEWATHLAAADLDGDGRVDVVGIGDHGGVVAWGNDGYELWRSPLPALEELLPGESGAPTIHDLDRDGRPEVILGRTVLDGRTGNLRWQGRGHTGRGTNDLVGPISCAGDLDGDGDLEVVAGRTAFRSDGRIFWNAPTPDGLCALGNVVDANDGPEVVLVSHGRLYVLDGRRGALLWERDLVGRAGRSVGGAPALGDLDGDGTQEIVVALGSAVAAYDEGCADCEDGVAWRVPIRDESSSSTTVALFDFEGDGLLEVVHNDHFMLRIIDGATGTMRAAMRNHSRTRSESPVVADVDGDDQAEIVIPSSSLMGRVPPHEPGVAVIGDAHGRWLDTRESWSQHALAGAHLDRRGAAMAPDIAEGFRHNRDPSVDPRIAPNLWIQRVTLRCTGPGRAVADVRVRNVGDLASPRGVPVTARSGDATVVVRTPRALPPGGAVTVRIGIDAVGWEWELLLDHDPELEPTSTVLECDETDNAYPLGAPRCE